MFSPSSKGLKGFSLVELIVTMGIMVAITTVVVYNQRDYSTTLTLKNATDNLALDIRQAQVYGISVKEFGPGGSGRFDIGYGISLDQHFFPRQYVSFGDFNKNGIYDGLEAENIVKLPTNIKFSAICIIPTSGAENCTRADLIYIMFKRPETTAHMTIRVAGGDGLLEVLNNIKGVRLVLASPGGLTKSVVIYPNGQISVQ